MKFVAIEHEAGRSGALAQQARFIAFTEQLASVGVKIPLKHACNSAAAMEMDDHFGMVRFGIGLYGLYPSEEVQKENLRLTPAMSWKTHVVHLKTVPPGTGISYGHTFVTQRETRVATLPVGYADGYPRALSNRGRVIIRGRYAPIIGRVCMDQCMADVTDIPGVCMEDEVILLGEQGNCRVTMEEIGALSASFNYETACRVSQRVPRVYMYQGKAVDFRSVLTTEEAFLPHTRQLS
jgi:alanine racemase